MTTRDLMVGLLDYVIEQAKAVDPAAFHLGKVKGTLFRPESLRGLPGIHFDLRETDDLAWMRVDRLEARPAPAGPPALAHFMTSAPDPFGSPPSLIVAVVKQHVDAQSNTEESQRRIDASFDDHLRRWNLWAEGERPRRSSMSVYGELFALKHQMDAEETSKPQEFLWGVGVASWRVPREDKHVEFEYPLLTHAIEIAIDSETMALELRPRDVATRIELDAIVACDVHGASNVERTMREQVSRASNPVSPFDPGSYEHVLKLAASGLDADGTFKPVLASDGVCPPPGTHLVVTDAWVMFSRPRSNNYLLEDIRRLREKVSDGAPIPDGPMALVTPLSDQVVEHDPIRFRGLSASPSGEGGKVQELFFPLPYNDEQVAIIERLERSPGVAVQGPPGTGKTHTIANVICHYLATGRRVLVTSRGEPALEVLQKMIPQEVRPLTVALLAGDREGVRQFQASIEAIQHRVSQLSPSATQEKIAHLREATDRTHEELISVDRRVNDIAIAQLSEIAIDGTVLRAQKAAELVVHGQEDHEWFDDALTLSSEHAPPLSDDEAAGARESRRKLGDDLVYLRTRQPKADELPSAAEIAELHGILSRIAALEQEARVAPAFSLRANTVEVLTAAEELLRILDSAHDLLIELERDAPKWGLALRERCRDAAFATERRALESVFEELDRLVAARAAFLQQPVTFPVGAMSHPKTVEAVQRAAETGKPFGVIAFGVAEAKSHLSAVRVSGLAPADASTWAHVLRYLQLHQNVLSFETRWNAFASDLGVPRLTGGVEALRRTEAVALAARKAHRMASAFDRGIPKKAEAVFARIPSDHLLGDAAALADVGANLRRHLTKSSLAKAAVARSTLDEKIAGTNGAISDALRSFVTNELGQATTTEAAISARYAGLVAELRRVAALANDLATVADCAAKLRQAGAIRFADRVERMICPRVGDDKIFPPSWRQAWSWARLRGHLESIDCRAELRTLSARRAELTRSLQRNYRESVALSAWLSTKQTATERVLGALAGYATAIRRIGQGTGTNALRYRRDAHDAMVDAAGAVPCWIMSHARISEAMPADIGAFDLVIVDEASQSDLWALPAVLRGKKILVVGDDKQVSPDGGFISAQHIDTLRKRFLSDQPHAASMTPEKSLYDLAARIFAAHQVMLREHFRCVEPIIAYSNRFYGNQIEPLRTPLASERLDPPLVDIFIPDGYRTEKLTNHAEAEAIAEEINAILDDPKMAGRSIGVVSLLGMEQAKHIDEVVRQRCALMELIKRGFECGDARTFQGSERDIMLLSMVADRENCHALSGNSAEQRFNVAASRARDRMYLVRSVGLNDLSEKDLRRSLLEHFSKPMVAVNSDADLASLCDSGFEREVFARLTSAGYRVVPQVKVGSYKIDLVVEGAEDRRLAIELDGDDFHGPDRWTHDAHRQRILERAGWTFWRCFASTWSLQKDSVFAELRSRLDELRIEPIGAHARMPALVERRVWRPKTDADNGPGAGTAEAPVNAA